MDITTLAARLPAGTVITDSDILAGYRHDRALDPAAGTPVALVRPTTTEHVSIVTGWADEHRVALIPRGAGTGLSGGATAQDGALMVTTERMREITVDPVTRTAVTQPGLLNAEVKRAAAEHGLWYPPDPSSFEICSIGGNAATNAGGLCCVKYGVTTDYILAMEVVLADGSVVRLGGPRLKDSAGLSLTKLFVGSEGTLGIITEARLRLHPAPRRERRAAWLLGSFEVGLDAMRRIIQRGATPAVLRLYDAAEADRTYRTGDLALLLALDEG
ncbi:MAG: FAD-binding oxidoreductase, partial [Stackebrandtia sp.]